MDKMERRMARIDSVYHYTSNERWRLIQWAGKLYAVTSPQNFGFSMKKFDVSKHARDIAKRSGDCIVGIPQYAAHRWASSGLMNHVLERTTGEVILDVPVLERSNAFVREHKYFSPRRMIEVYGENLWGSTVPNDPRVDAEIKRYFESAVPLEGYDGNYEVPEVWLPQNTPLSLLTKL